MSEIKSYRKPYHRPAEKLTWWTHNPFYVKFMLRELTAVTALFAALEIILGVFLFALCNLEFARIPEAAELIEAFGAPHPATPYLWFLQSFLGNPLIILLNILTLAAQLFHMVTWFSLMPKAVRLFMNKNSTELLPDYVTKLGLYAAAFGATVIILVAAFATV